MTERRRYRCPRCRRVWLPKPDSYKRYARLPLVEAGELRCNPCERLVGEYDACAIAERAERRLR